MTSTKRRLKIEAKRRALSTMPDQNPPRSDDISYDLKGITVEMVDWPNNPYKPIFELVTSTWNSRATWGQRWKNTKPEDRMEVVCAALSGRTLPAALETVSFTFKVQGLSRSAFDQLCLLPGSWIITSNGAKVVEEIRPGDLVWTHKGLLKKVLSVGNRPYKGKIYGIKVGGYTNKLWATGEHPIYTKDGFKLAKELREKHDYTFTPSPSVEEIEEIDLSPFYWNFQCRDKRYHQEKIELVDLDKEFGKLCGLYIAEGSATVPTDEGGRKRLVHRNGFPTMTIFSFSYDEEETLVPECMGLLERFQVKGSHLRIKLYPGRACRINFTSAQLSTFFSREFGDISYHKKIPEWVFGAPREFKEGLIEGYYAGDGGVCINPAGNKYYYGTTCSPSLAFQLQLLLISLGYTPGIRNYHPTYWNISYHPKKKKDDVKAMITQDGGVWRKIIKIEEGDYEGTVYCIEVEEDQSYLTSIGAVHNSRHRHAAIGSVGARDTCHRDASLLLPNELKRYAPEMEAWWKSTKDLYDKITQNGQESWQNARFIMPLGQQWRFTWALNYRGLQQMCAQRFCFAEQADTVATAYLHQKALAKRFPLLAVHLRLPCDLRRKCLYSQMYDLSEMFSGLFLPCGRYPTDEQPYALFNRASTNSEEISENIGMEILSLREWEGSLEEAKELDMIYFQDLPNNLP